MPSHLVLRLGNWWSAAVAVLFLGSLWVHPSFAQVDRAQLNGTVTDPTGAFVPGAKVEAIEGETGKQREVLTNAAGIYILPLLPVGTYTFVFSHTGFDTVRYEGVELKVGQRLTLDVKLKVGSLSTRVEVKGTAPLLERSSAELAGVVQGSQISNLPVNGRNWASLLLLAPGAIDDGGGDQRTIRFAGRGRDDNNYKLDGVDATGIQEQAQKSTTRLQVSEDAVEEYRVNSMLYTAEYGAGAGGQVDIVTKTGTNKFHGALFEYLRNSALDSRSFLDLDNDPAAMGSTRIPPFRLNQFGGTFGGPIVKDRTFFFVDYEGLRQFRGQTLHAFVPSASFKAQVLATSPQMGPIMQVYPAGQLASCAFSTDPSCVQTDEFTHQGSVSIKEDSFLVRLDHRFNDSTTLYFRAGRDVSHSDAPLGNLLDTQGIDTNPANYVVAVQHAYSPTTFNESKFGINRSPFHNPQRSVFPFAVNSNFEALNNSNTDNEVGTTFGWIDNLTITRGRNTFKMGGEFRRIRLNQGITADPILDFSDNNSLINDQLSDFVIRESWWGRGYRRFLIMPYFQDEWKVRPNLTVNMGLRWEYYSVPKEAHDRLTVFDLERCQGVCPTGSPTEFPNRRNFDPRFSVAWSPKRFDNKTVIRTGFGIYHGAGQNDDANAAFESNTNRLLLTSSDVANLSYPIDSFLPLAAIKGRDPRALQRDRRDLYAEEWGLSVQQALPHDFVLQTGYLGTSGIRLFARTYVNVCTDSLAAREAGNCTRPLPQFGEVDLKRNDGNSTFHALQISLERHLTEGWLWEAQYMWSHSINDGSVGGGEANAAENIACRRCDRGPSVFDIRHNFVANSVYELPVGPGRRYWKPAGFAGKLLEGWNLSGVGIWRTGHPLTVTFNPGSSNLPDGNDRSDQRPDLVPGVSVAPGNPSVNNWININAFQSPPTDPNGFLLRFGNAGRGLIRSPHVWQVDLALTKETKINERLSLEFRVEAFNIFNHDQFSDPNLTLNFNPSCNNPDPTVCPTIVPTSSLSDPGGFGQITSSVNFNANNDSFAPSNTGTGVPRQIEFSLRLVF